MNKKFGGHQVVYFIKIAELCAGNEKNQFCDVLQLGKI